MRKKEKGKEAVVGVLENDFKRGGSPRFVLRSNNPLKQVEEEKESLWIRLWRTVKHKWKWLLRDLLVTSFNDEGGGGGKIEKIWSEVFDLYRIFFFFFSLIDETKRSWQTTIGNCFFHRTWFYDACMFGKKG